MALGFSEEMARFVRYSTTGRLMVCAFLILGVVSAIILISGAGT